MTESAEQQASKSASTALMIMGVITIILGILAIGSPFVAGAAVAMIIGAVLLVAGLIEVIHAVREHTAGASAYVIALLTVICGVLVLTRPASVAAILSFVLAGYFALDGIMRCTWAIQARPAKGWGCLLFSGLLSLSLGIMIWRAWPLSGFFAIGVLVGVRLLISGWAMVILSSAVREASPPQS